LSKCLPYVDPGRTSRGVKSPQDWT